MREVVRVFRLMITVVVALAAVWYVWALFPSIGQPPGVGKLFTKPTPNVSKLATELHAVPPRSAKVPVADIKDACSTWFFLRPLQGPPDHATLQVTSGLTTIQRSVSCKTYQYISPWVKVR
jgi:hypothetical protein